MKINAELKQFDFEHLKNGLLVVTYKPFSSPLSKKQFFTLFEQHTRYYNLAMKVSEKCANWVEINYLAQFIEEYHGQIISQI